MKISVSATGESLDSDVDPRFGRAAGFVLFDRGTGDVVYLDNSAQRDLAKGTGIKAAQMIAKAGTEVLITGQLGPNASQLLGKSGIKIYACTSGTVREAIQALQEDRLKELGDATSPGQPLNQEAMSEALGTLPSIFFFPSTKTAGVNITPRAAISFISVT